MMRGPKLVGAKGKAFPRKPPEGNKRLRRRYGVKESELGEGTGVSEGLRSLPSGVDRGRQGPDGAEPQSGMIGKPAHPHPKRNPN